MGTVNFFGGFNIGGTLNWGGAGTPAELTPWRPRKFFTACCPEELSTDRFQIGNNDVLRRRVYGRTVLLVPSRIVSSFQKYMRKKLGRNYRGNSKVRSTNMLGRNQLLVYYMRIDLVKINSTIDLIEVLEWYFLAMIRSGGIILDNPFQ